MLRISFGISISILVLSFLSQASYGQSGLMVFRVDGMDGSTSGDGSGWGQDALLYLQDALAAAEDWIAFDPPNNTAEIWVRGATDGIKYRPDQSAAYPNGCLCPQATFQLIAKVKLYGGFHNTHTQLGDRAPQVYRTILTGDLGFQNWVWDNSYRVVTASGGTITVSNCLVDGFDIRDGWAYYQPPTPITGAGVFCTNGASPRFERCRILENAAIFGGGVFVDGVGMPPNAAPGASPAFIRCVISSNQVYQYYDEVTQLDFGGVGAGLYCDGTTSVKLVNCEITSNGDESSMDVGAGVFVQISATLEMVNCVVAFNGAAQPPAWPPASGGGILNQGTVTMINSTIVGNHSTGDGAGYGERSVSSQVTTQINNTIFWDNTVGATLQQIHLSTGHPASIRHCDVQGGLSGITGATPTTYENNIDADPLFDDNLIGLRYQSPCLNNGDPAALPADLFDLDGNGQTTNQPIPHDLAGFSRQRNPAVCVDIGAMENQVVGTPDCPADVGGTSGTGSPDGQVNVNDLLLVLNKWGTPGGIIDFMPSPCGDGLVNVNELLEVIDNWGVCGGIQGSAPETIEDCYDDCHLLYPDDAGKFAECIEACIESLCKRELIDCD